MKTILIFCIIFLAIVAWFIFSKVSTPQSDIVSNSGLHWHPELTIKINGEIQEIPGNVGMIPQEMPIHTHDKDGIIHLEFGGKVFKGDIKLGKFFQIWGKKFTKDCIFDKCSGQGGKLTMLVNGKENLEFENYIMRDKDKIEIIFEASPLQEIKEITVIGTEFAFSPSTIAVKPGEKIRITFKNEGNIGHNLVFDGLDELKTKTINNDQNEVIEFNAPYPIDNGRPLVYTFFCSIPGHKEAGMKGELKVE